MRPYPTRSAVMGVDVDLASLVYTAHATTSDKPPRAGKPEGVSLARTVPAQRKLDVRAADDDTIFISGCLTDHFPFHRRRQRLAMSVNGFFRSVRTTRVCNQSIAKVATRVAHDTPKCCS